MMVLVITGIKEDHIVKNMRKILTFRSLLKNQLQLPLYDIDNNIYHTAIIGSQEWILENLKVTKYANGDIIPNVTIDATWDTLLTGAYCWFDNNIIHKTPRGALYNFYAISDIRGLVYFTKGGILETGYRVATQTDYDILIALAGGLTVAGGKLKEVGVVNWYDPNIGATDDYGWKGIPGGYRNDDGTFYLHVNQELMLWSSTSGVGTYAKYFQLNQGSIIMTRSDYQKQAGFTVRCVRDI
jgi:uncharacterized protein (TIGR02145 family)